MQRSKNDVWVGLFVLIGAAAILFLALQSANLLNLSFQTTYRVEARFDNIGGLKPKAAVKSGGVVVGRVESISFDDRGFQARVLLALEKRYKFPKDSSLKVLTSGLLGDQYISIEAGAEDENLAQGDVISSTQSAMVLENLIGQFLYNKAAEGKSGGNSSAPAKPVAPSPPVTAPPRPVAPVAAPAPAKVVNPPPAAIPAPAAAGAQAPAAR